MEEFFSVTLLFTLSVISPGPDFALVTKNSILYSRQAGVYTSLGIASCLLIHATYCSLGLALIISESALLFATIKYLGAIYLIYLGIKSLLAKREDFAVTSDKSTRVLSPAQAFRQGFLCNLFNAKAILFFLAIFTLVLKPGHSVYVMIAYIIEMALIPLMWFSSLSYLFTYQPVKFYLNKAQFYIVKAMGVLLLGFGLSVAMLNKASQLIS